MLAALVTGLEAWSELVVVAVSLPCSLSSAGLAGLSAAGVVSADAAATSSVRRQLPALEDEPQLQDTLKRRT